MSSAIITQKPAAAPSPWHIWRQWVAANMLAELVGLGGSAVIGALMFPRLGNTVSSIIMLALLMILCGTFLEGVLVALPQWVVLRHYVRRAGWWIPANALAWAAGMVVVFMGTSIIPAEGINPAVGMVLLVTLAVAGAIVGAIHGLTLVWFCTAANKKGVIKWT